MNKLSKITLILRPKVPFSALERHIRLVPRIFTCSEFSEIRLKYYFFFIFYGIWLYISYCYKFIWVLFFVGNQASFLKNMNFRASSLQKSRKSEKNKAVFLQFLRSVPDTFWPVSYFFCGHNQSVCMGKIWFLQIS